MSCSVSGILINSHKLLVHIAENGRSFEIDCEESSFVEEIQSFIESLSGIHSNDQLLLCSGMKLEPQNQLSEYNLPSDDLEVFLFNKTRLQPNSPLPLPEEIDVDEVEDPKTSSVSYDPHPLDDATDPALKALPSYERQFRYHYHRGDSIYTRTQKNLDRCRRILKEVKVQERSVEVGRSNFEQYYRIVSQNYSDFIKRYAQQFRYHSELISNFTRNVDGLRFCKLHPSLQTPTYKCLLDFVKEMNLQKSFETCSSSHRQLEVKISQLKHMFTEVKGKAEDIMSSRVSSPITNMESMIKEHSQYIQEQKCIMQSLSKDVSTVKKLVEDCLSLQLSPSLRPHDAVSALGPMYDVHDNSHLPKMQSFDHSVSKMLDYFKDKKNEINMFVHTYMQKIAYMSYVIKDAKLQFHVFKEAIHRQDDLFVNMKLVHGIGHSYRACLAEIVRRKSFMKLYMGTAGQFAESLSVKRDSEVKRRDEFLTSYGVYIPKDILSSMGLYDTPNLCYVNVSPSDSHLLDIDIPDIDRYSPKYLSGFPYGNENAGNWDLFPTSYEVSNFSEVEGISRGTNYTEEKTIQSELVEIPGTGKIEVENAKLKAELASKIALISLLGIDFKYQLLDDNEMETLLKNATDKTAEALHHKHEYEKHLQSLLVEKETKCASYEKRIRELEQILSDQHGQNPCDNKDEDSSVKADECKSDTSRDGVEQMPCLVTSEPMDEVSSTSNCLYQVKSACSPIKFDKIQEGTDDNMFDSSGVLNTQMDLLKPGQPLEELKVTDSVNMGGDVCQMGILLGSDGTINDNIPPFLINLSCAEAEQACDSHVSCDNALELHALLAEKSSKLDEAESKIKALTEESLLLAKELETSRKLLDKTQMNCVHLENCLYEAKEEARTHLCAADRRAMEYSALRTNAVKLRSLFERLRNCVTSTGMALLSESLQALVQSLANESGENGVADFRACVQMMADKVGFLCRHRAELLERLTTTEAALKQLTKEVEEKKVLVQTLYSKHRLEKQANKERKSFGRLEVHEIAAFVLKEGGKYEAINRDCSNYFLSAESVALFTQHLPRPPPYVIGQIVHIERRMMTTTTDDAAHITNSTQPSPDASHHFVVTVAMLPNTSSSSSSSSVK